VVVEFRRKVAMPVLLVMPVLRAALGLPHRG